MEKAINESPMKNLFDNLLLKKTFALVWAAACIVVAAFYPARFTILQGSSLYFIDEFPEKVASIPFATYFYNLVIAFLGIFIFSIVLISTGSIVLQILKLNRNKEQNIFSFISQIGTSFLLGHWVLAVVFMLFAMSNQLTRVSVIWTLLIALIVSIPSAVKAFVLPIKRGQIKLPDFQLGKRYKIILGLSTGLVFISLLYSTSRLGYDANYIYFSDPKLTAISHQLKFFLNDMFVISSFQTGIQFSVLMLVFNDQTARLFSWVSGMVFIFLSLALSEKAGLSDKAKVIFLSLILTSTAFVDLLGDAKVDLTSSAIAIAAIYWMFIDDNKNIKLIAGFFLGFAISSRPYNLFLISVFTLFLYLIRFYLNRKEDIQSKGFQSFMASMFWIGLGAILPLAFHLLANWVVFDNMLIMFKNTPNISSQNWQWSFDPHDVWIMRLLYPFVVTFLNTSQSIGDISPLFLAFLPFLMIKGIREKLEFSRPLVEMLYASLITLFLWITFFFTIMEIRYIFFIWAILFIGTSNIIEKVLDSLAFAFTSILSILILVLLGYNVFRTIYISLDSYSPVDMQGNPQCSGHAFCDYLTPINEQASSGNRVLSLLAYRYYLRTDLFACATRLTEYDRIRDATKKGSEEFWLEVYRQGYSYVAYENNYSVRHLYIDFVPDPKTTPDWIELETLYGGIEDGVAAYHIITHNPPISNEKTCIQNSGVWEVETIH